MARMPPWAVFTQTTHFSEQWYNEFLSIIKGHQSPHLACVGLSRWPDSQWCCFHDHFCNNCFLLYTLGNKSLILARQLIPFHCTEKHKSYLICCCCVGTQRHYNFLNLPLYERCRYYIFFRVSWILEHHQRTICRNSYHEMNKNEIIRTFENFSESKVALDTISFRFGRNLETSLTRPNKISVWRVRSWASSIISTLKNQEKLINLPIYQ